MSTNDLENKLLNYYKISKQLLNQIDNNSKKLPFIFKFIVQFSSFPFLFKDQFFIK